LSQEGFAEAIQVASFRRVVGGDQSAGRKLWRRTTGPELPISCFPVAAQRRTVKRRSKKKSAAIVGGSALGGAAIGGLAGGKKGAAIVALAGGGAGYVYDRKSQKKTVAPN